MKVREWGEDEDEGRWTIKVRGRGSMKVMGGELLILQGMKIGKLKETVGKGYGKAEIYTWGQ